MGTPKTRKDMLKIVLNSITKAMAEGKAVDESHLIAYLGVDHGVSRRTALNYLKTLELAEEIVRHDGRIYTKKAFNEIEEFTRKQEREADEIERRSKS